MKIARKLDESLGIPDVSNGNLNFSKIVNLHNFEDLAELKRKNPHEDTSITLAILKLFSCRNWEKNEIARKGLVTSIVKWHRAKNMKDM